MRADPAFTGYFEYLGMRQVTKEMVIEKMKAKGVEADALELFSYGVDHGLHKPQTIPLALVLALALRLPLPLPLA